MSHARAARETRRSRVTSLDTSYLLIKCLFVAICRKIFKLWFLRYKRKVIHRHLCRALAKKVRSLFKIVGYIYSYLSLKPTLLEATLSVCLRDVFACCLPSWRDLIVLVSWQHRSLEGFSQSATKPRGNLLPIVLWLRHQKNNSSRPLIQGSHA